MDNLIAVCPIHDRLELAVASIRSLNDLGVSVLGVADGTETFDYQNPLFRFIPYPKGGVHVNALRRIEEGARTEKQWIYLFDTDIIHLPSALEALKQFSSKIKDKEMVSLYISRCYRVIGNDGMREMQKTQGLGGASILMNRTTAQDALEKYSGFVMEKAKTGYTDWDNNITKHYDCFRNNRSYCEHIDPYGGMNGQGRKLRRINERAQNIDVGALHATLSKLGVTIQNA